MHAKRVVQTANCLGKSKEIEETFWKTNLNFGKLRKFIPNARTMHGPDSMWCEEK